MKKAFFLIIILLMMTSVHAESGPLEIYVSDVSVTWTTDGPNTFWLVNSSVSVYNPTSEAVSFTYSDLCEFKLQINTTVEGLDTQYPFACAEATKTVDFESGVTRTSALGAINTETELLADGEYTLDIVFHEFQSSPIKAVHPLYFDVVNGSISNVIPVQLVIQPQDSLDGSLPLAISGVISAIIGSVLILRVRKH